MATPHEEKDVLQFRSVNQPNLHLVYWTRAPLADKPSPCILVINHGFGEHSGRYRRLVAQLLHAVPSLDAAVSYDMRNHGMSEGERGTTKSIEQYVDDLYEHVLPRVSMRYGTDANVVLFGHSLGGAVVAGAATRPDCLLAEGYGTLKGLVLSAPCLEAHVRGVVNKALQPLAGVLSRLPGVKGMTRPSGLNAKMLCSDAKVVEDYEKDEMTYDIITVGVASECLSYSGNVIASINTEDNCLLNTVPTLVLHGTSDQIVKIDGSRKLVAALQQKGKVTAKLVEVEGAMHEIHNEPLEKGSKIFVDSVSEFLTSAFAA